MRAAIFASLSGGAIWQMPRCRNLNARYFKPTVWGLKGRDFLSNFYQIYVPEIYLHTTGPTKPPFGESFMVHQWPGGGTVPSILAIDIIYKSCECYGRHPDESHELPPHLKSHRKCPRYAKNRLLAAIPGGALAAFWDLLCVNLKKKNVAPWKHGLMIHNCALKLYQLKSLWLRILLNYNHLISCSKCTPESFCVSGSY